MKIKTMSLFVLSFFITGCAGTLPSRPVTMIGNDKDHYIGKLVYQDGLVSGILSIDVGPNGEAFTGNYVVVNRTAYSSTQGSAVVPLGNQFPAVGKVGSTSSGRMDASGYWYASGNKGSIIKCVLQIGAGFHGQGLCKHSNGKEYEMIF